MVVLGGEKLTCIDLYNIISSDSNFDIDEAILKKLKSSEFVKGPKMKSIDLKLSLTEQNGLLYDISHMRSIMLVKLNNLVRGNSKTRVNIILFLYQLLINHITPFFNTMEDLWLYLLPTSILSENQLELKCFNKSGEVCTFNPSLLHHFTMTKDYDFVYHDEYMSFIQSPTIELAIVAYELGNFGVSNIIDIAAGLSGEICQISEIPFINTQYNRNHKSLKKVELI